MQKENNSIYMIIGSIVSILTLSIGFYLFYEYFFCHHYWHNRILLFKKLKRREWYPVSSRNLFGDIQEYMLNNGGRVWVYKDRKVLTYSGDGYSDYIGLFLYSPIMKFYNRKILSENFLSIEDSRDSKIKKILR
jgi:hypothetical protein